MLFDRIVGQNKPYRLAPRETYLIYAVNAYRYLILKYFIDKPRSNCLNVVFYLYFAVNAVPSNAIPSQPFNMN